MLLDLPLTSCANSFPRSWPRHHVNHLAQLFVTCSRSHKLMSYEVKSPKKLIEVALPLEAINAAAAREKSIRHGHPSTLHIWWARRPLAAAQIGRASCRERV